MASHQDLLDAIARVGAATGDRHAWQSGLSGEDIATACSLSSSSAARGAVLTRMAAAHPEVFLTSGPAGPPTGENEGRTADAIRGAETALAQQNSAAAQVDLQVVTAVLNAHAANATGAAALDGLQHEIETAVLSRTDLDTPAGAREFQRFLIGKLCDIRTVVDSAGLDATSRAALAAALASLYAAATPSPTDAVKPDSTESPPTQTLSTDGPGGGVPRGRSAALPESPPEATELWGPGDLPPVGTGEFATGNPTDLPAPAPTPAPAMPAPAVPAPAMAPPAMAQPAMSPPPMAPPTSGWGSALPGLGSGGISSSPSSGGPDPLPDRAGESRRPADPDQSDAPGDGTDGEPADQDPGMSQADDPLTVHLPGGETVSAPTAEVAAAMTAALAGTPIPEAFRQQGITVPVPGTAIPAPVTITDVVPGDIGVLADRHALALGNGKALLDNRIAPIASVTAAGFLGWQHPPVPGPPTPMAPTPMAPTPMAPTPILEPPAPNRPAATAPS